MDFDELTERQELVLREGESRTLYARPFLLSRLVIPKSATLVVPKGGQSWLALDVDGDAEIDGRIVYRHVPDLTGVIRAEAPNGDDLEYEFARRNRGGRGGSGGEFQGRRGGDGADGSVRYGGGGGSGAWHFRSPPPGNGRPGSGQYGGTGAYGNVGRGGDGGSLPQFLNGGLIYLNVTGALTGTGSIDVRGSRGEDGQPGSNGWQSGVHGSAGGGGGGGGPGGCGGIVIIRAANNTSNLNIRVNGGDGGPAGSAGWRGRNGEQGESGPFGSIKFL